MKKTAIVLSIIAFCALAYATERRLIGKEDVNWGISTFQDSGGSTFNQINADDIPISTDSNITVESRITDNAAITGGTVDGAVIGGTTPAAGTFTTLIGTSGSLQKMAIDNSAIGGTTSNTGKFTTLESTGQATFDAGAKSIDDQSFQFGTDTDWYCKYVSASQQLICYTANTGSTMTDTNGMVVFHVAVGGTLDTGQRIFVVKDDSTTYMFLDQSGNLTITGELTATSFATTGTDNTFYINVANSGDPSSPTAGDCYYNTTDNTFKCYNGATWGTVGP